MKGTFRSRKVMATHMSRSITNGSSTHARYGHRSRPKRLDVKCPRCGYLAKAEKDSEKKSGAIIGDLSPTWEISDWRVTCLSCPHRIDSLAYEDLPELFYSQDEFGVWAWNREHLFTLLRYLNGESMQDDPYAWFLAYVPGKWKKQKTQSIISLEKMYKRPVTQSR